MIEFTNRQLTFVVALVVVATWVLALVLRRERALATAVARGIPAQAVLGGITVLTDLNPWVVAPHFLLSMAIIAATLVLGRGCGPTPPRAAVPIGGRALAGSRPRPPQCRSPSAPSSPAAARTPATRTRARCAARACRCRRWPQLHADR